MTWLAFPPDGDVTDSTARVYLKAATVAPPPPPPVGVTNALTATALATGRVKLAWDEQSTGDVGYNVERAPDVAGVPGTFVQIGTTTNPNFTFFDGTTAPSTKDYYRVKPANSAGITGTASNVASERINLGGTLEINDSLGVNLPDRLPDDAPVLLDGGTIYLVGESDTLGKDSELASTLAQGKPVIAFVPQVPSDYAKNLISRLKLIYPRRSEQELVLQELGVHPIWYDDHNEIPAIIRSIATK